MEANIIMTKVNFFVVILNLTMNQEMRLLSNPSAFINTMLLLTLMDNTRVGFFVQIFIWRVIIVGKIGKW